MAHKESAELQDERYRASVLTERYFGDFPLEVRQEIGRGRYVVAKRSIKGGDIVCDALPYVHAVEDELKDVACAHCLKPALESFSSVFSSSIGSVDAVLYNERIDAGEDFAIIQQELTERARIMQEANDALDDGFEAISFAEAFENMELQNLSSPSHNPSQSHTKCEPKPWSIHCEECQQVWYCSEPCRLQNSKLHALICRALVKLRQVKWNYSDMTMARLVIQIMAKRHLEMIAQTGKDEMKVEGENNEEFKENLKESGENNDKFNLEDSFLSCVGGIEHSSESARKNASFMTFEFDVLSLVSNERDIAPKTFSRRRPLVAFLKKLSEKFEALQLGDSSLIVPLIGKIDQNTFGVRFDRNLSYAFGLFPTMSYFNHTCAPNVCVIQHNTALNIMAMRDIEVGEEVAISYIEVNRATKDRRKCLQAEYNFFCRCTRCNAPPTNTDLVDDFVETYVCKNKTCDGKGLLIPLKQPVTVGAKTINAACNICQSTLIIKRKIE